MSQDPAFQTIRNLILRHGSRRFSDPAEVYNALVIVRELKEAGHAVVMDDTYDHEKKFLETHVLHYSTCRACHKEKADGRTRQSDGTSTTILPRRTA